MHYTGPEAYEVTAMAAAWSLRTYFLWDGKNWDFDGCPGHRSLGDLGRARGQEASEQWKFQG